MNFRIIFNIWDFLLPSHGGRDAGTSYGKIYEKDLNLAISKVLKNVLEEKGATVYMIREDDSDLSSKWDRAKKRGDLYRRILKIQENKSDLYLSIHINYHYYSSVSGAEVLYHPINPNNLILAESIMDEFKNNLNTNRKVIKTKKSVTLEPMKAYERKIIHSHLQDSQKVQTKSIGEEPNRRIVISLKNN